LLLPCMRTVTCYAPGMPTHAPQVRGAAVKVAVLAHDAAGPAVRRLLPRDLNPKIRAQLDAALGVEAGERRGASQRTHRWRLGLEATLRKAGPLCGYPGCWRCWKHVVVPRSQER
jgi:hypothetical protein